MNITTLFVVVALACGMPGGAVSAAAARQVDTSYPPVFTQLGLEAARKKAADEQKLLVVKATAAWCGPCKTMDKTTWRHKDVEAWFKDRPAIAIQLDVDKFPKDAQTLRVRAMPTMIAIKGDEEVGRVVGMQSAEQLLGWLERVEKGEDGNAAIVERLKKARADPESMSMQDRMTLARELAEAGDTKQAAEEYVWLWDNMERYQPSMSGVRVSFMIGDMKDLAEENVDAKAAFAALRDREWEKSQGAGVAPEIRSESIGDWIALNEALGERSKTLEWYDKVSNDPQWDLAVQRASYWLKDLLAEAERWADLGRMLEEPEAVIERAYRPIELDKRHGNREVDDQMRAMITQMNERTFREESGRAHAAYLAANRDNAAAELAEGAIKKDDTPAMRVSLVRWALKAGQARESQRAWLDQAAAAGDDWPGVRKALDDALKQKVAEPVQEKAEKPASN